MAKRNGKKMTVTAETGVSVTEKRFLGDAPPPPEPPQRIRIRVGDVVPAPGLNTRRHFDEADLRSLAQSMREMGQQQAVVLHDTGEPIKHLVAGERRYRAAKLLGDDFELEATIRKYSDAELVQLMLIENFQRADLRPIEEARALQKGLELPGMTQRKLGELVGREQGTISNAVRLLKLPDSILDLIDDGKLGPTVVRDVLLPFAALREPQRTQFLDTVAKKLRQEVANVDDARRVVSDVAAKLSRPIDQAGRIYHVEHSIELQFDAKEHEACGCGGPVFRYWGNAGLRCFDIAWWDTAQRTGAERRREAERAEQERLRAAAEKKGRTTAVKKMKADRFYQEYGYNRKAIGEEPLDVGELGDATFTVVTSSSHHHIGDPRVYCTDQGAVRRARKAANEKRKALYEERVAAVVAEERAEADRISDASADIIRTILAKRPATDQLAILARRHGIDLGRHGQIYDKLGTLSDADALLLAKLILVAERNGRLTWKDPLQEEVDGVMRRRYASSLAALRRRVLGEAGVVSKKPKRKEAADQREDDDAEVDSAEMAEV